jgi:hypothetical protein
MVMASQSLRVLLPNGRNVDVYSKEGANEFVDTVGTDFISMNLTAKANQYLTFAYALMAAVAEHASSEKMASGIPESELRTMIEHAAKTLKTLSTNRNWLRSGTVSQCHVSLLQALACFAKHSSSLKVFLSSEGMEAVANFYASRKKNDKPSHGVAQHIVSLVANSFGAFDAEGVSDERRSVPLRRLVFLDRLFAAFPLISKARLRL